MAAFGSLARCVSFGEQGLRVFVRTESFSIVPGFSNVASDETLAVLARARTARQREPARLAALIVDEPTVSQMLDCCRRRMPQPG